MNPEVRLPGFESQLFCLSIGLSLLSASLPYNVRKDMVIALRLTLDNPRKVLSMVLGTYSGLSKYS